MWAFDAFVLGTVQRGAIHAALWTASLAAKQLYFLRPLNMNLWLPVIPGHYLSLEKVVVS
jgi:hypothetical protein